MSSSTTGTITTSITADSLSAAKTVVVREDIYKGTTLIGTTYRNVSFSSNYVIPIPSITYNGVATTYTTSALAAAAPTTTVSTTNTTLLTFTNSTVAPFNGNWDNSVMTLTIT